MSYPLALALMLGTWVVAVLIVAPLMLRARDRYDGPWALLIGLLVVSAVGNSGALIAVSVST